MRLENEQDHKERQYDWVARFSLSRHGDGAERPLPASHGNLLSHGKVNIFNLAKNAGTSVEQIERFYAKHLPLSREMAKNLQSFGEE